MPIRMKQTPNVVSRRVLAVALVVALVGPMSPAYAEVVVEIAKDGLNRASLAMRSRTNQESASAARQPAQQPEDPSEAATRVTHLRLCPRHLTLYVGDVFDLSPLPLDGNREVVQGVQMSWSTNDE